MTIGKIIDWQTLHWRDEWNVVMVAGLHSKSVSGAVTSSSSRKPNQAWIVVPA